MCSHQKKTLKTMSVSDFSVCCETTPGLPVGPRAGTGGVESTKQSRRGWDFGEVGREGLETMAWKTALWVISSSP